ncbi:hypothetical protein TIFTF001_036111 [Ficus carica]|uniref:Uncharacterized protein n=1 Tax=Ficus carica TaxID=3494 RepID=A0AA88E3P2_FICCA|nr:hypothetical protein TIFTF001_036111 [Ficus carica]
MFTIDNSYGKNETKFQVRFGPWFELIGLAAPTIPWQCTTVRTLMLRAHVVLAERKLTTYVYAVGKLPTGNV